MARRHPAKAPWPSALPRASGCTTWTPASSTAPWPVMCSAWAVRRRRRGCRGCPCARPGRGGRSPIYQSQPGEAASIVARIPQVRAALLGSSAPLPPATRGAGRPRHRHRRLSRAVRDLPAPRVRAERRYLEMQGRGEAATYEGVLADIRRRDQRDASRDTAPMRSADDAFLLDTSNLDIEAAFDTAVGVILRKAGQRGRA